MPPLSISFWLFLLAHLVNQSNRGLIGLKTLLNPLFLVCVAVAGINQLLERNGIFIPIVHSYLDDVLCFPIVLTASLAAYRMLHQNPNYLLTHWQVWPVVGLYAVVFEGVLPSHSKVYTADVMDVVAYVLGAMVFMKWINTTRDLGAAPEAK